jgi:Uma2 family endonuclease
LALEVRSPSDRWSKVISKSGEYLETGVTYDCVLDEQTQTAHNYTPNDPERVVVVEKKLTFPDLLPGFAVKVKQFFE